MYSYHLYIGIISLCHYILLIHILFSNHTKSIQKPLLSFNEFLYSNLIFNLFTKFLEEDFKILEVEETGDEE